MQNDQVLVIVILSSPLAKQSARSVSCWDSLLILFINSRCSLFISNVDVVCSVVICWHMTSTSALNDSLSLVKCITWLPVSSSKISLLSKYDSYQILTHACCKPELMCNIWNSIQLFMSAMLIKQQSNFVIISMETWITFLHLYLWKSIYNQGLRIF